MPGEIYELKCDMEKGCTSPVTNARQQATSTAPFTGLATTQLRYSLSQTCLVRNQRTKTRRVGQKVLIGASTG